jgi:hypothetical protein
MSEADDVFAAGTRAVLCRLSDVNERVASRLLELAEITPDAKHVLLSEAERLRSAAERVRKAATGTAESRDVPA